MGNSSSCCARSIGIAAFFHLNLCVSMNIQTVVKTSKNSLIEAGQFIAKITETSAEHQENLTIFFLKPPCPNGHRKTWFLIYFSKTFTHR